jgi:hypothetical protein
MPAQGYYYYKQFMVNIQTGGGGEKEEGEAWEVQAGAWGRLEGGQRWVFVPKKTNRNE